MTELRKLEVVLEIDWESRSVRIDSRSLSLLPCKRELKDALAGAEVAYLPGLEPEAGALAAKLSARELDATLVVSRKSAPGEILLEIPLETGYGAPPEPLRVEREP